MNDSEILAVNYQTLKNQLYFSQSKAVDLLEFDGTVYLLDSKEKLILSGQPNPKIDPDYFQNNQVNNRENSEITSTNKISATGYFSYQKKGQEYIAAYSRINTFDWTIVVDGRKNKILDSVTRTKNSMILIGLVLIILVIITVYLFSSYILNIVDQVLDFTNEVSKGNLTVEKA